ncbi:hypothetical protein [Blastococcus sp. LR1]|uniref:Acg family FMN-binding oxidoreductase n=1 Tax=Blastococcus sp. LR1 TaxID=2877000 RepID=UPI001CCD66D7|nr:hypothetical protein [Blastococcus sp. LR1]MCA0143411.1 hypothetical protein [Blastococcus sp. LR1]
MEQQDWTRVVDAATRAPSIHNTQPWRFVARPETLELHLDEARSLPVLDPTGRQQVISCGIALEFAVVALAAQGWGAEVELLPAGGALGAVRLTGPAPATDEARSLADAIRRRHTVRTPFARQAVPEGLIERLQAEAEEFGTWLKPITRSEEEVATVFLISRAEEMEQGDPAYLAELESWLRTDPGAEDGVPVGALPEGDPSERASNWLIRDFVAGQREPHAFRAAGDPDAPPPEVERPAVVLMGTDGDDRAAWLSSGRALGRVLLRLTDAGLVASPLTQALDWPATRTRMQARLSLVGHPQMLLRLGYPQEGPDAVVSGRRPVADVLRLEAPGVEGGG